MSDACNHDCGGCAQDCTERADLKKAPHAGSHIKKVIGVVSGKGGVGKTLVTSLLAVNLRRLGYKTAILDADITGPSVPKAFGIHAKAASCERGLFPVESGAGVPVMSVNLLLPNETDPVIWRGPVIAGLVTQFWTDVIWGDVDYMLVDMPPGTGDVSLTIFQTLPVDGLVIVTSPQSLVSMIVSKAVNMVRMMDIPVLSLAENMSFARCPDCGKELQLFGESRVQETAREFGIEVTDRIPLDPSLAALCDAGAIASFEGALLPNTTSRLEALLQTAERLEQ